GKTTYRNEHSSFGIKERDRRQHTYIVGKTGTGKSTLIKNMAIQDMRKGKGIALIDPHGDLAEDLLNFVPKSRTNDVTYFDPSDGDYSVGLNIMESKSRDSHHLVASSLVSVFRHLWKDSWGPRLEYVLF